MATRLFDSSLLRTSEEALDFIGNILESSTEYSIIGKDLEGNIVLWNEGARRIYGYDPDEVVGKASAALLHTPEDVTAGKPRAILEAARRDGKWEGTLLRLRKNSERFTARAVVTPRRDQSGQVVGYLLISKDITEETRLVDARQHSEERLQGLVDSAMDAIITIDAGQRITLFNPAAERMFGFNSTDMLGQPLERLIPERFRAGHGQHIRDFDRTGTTSRTMGALGAINGLRANGEEFPIEASISQIDIAGQKLFTVILRDITERTQVEAALRDSEERFRTMADSIPQLAWIAHRDGYIFWYNRRWYEYTGTTPEQMEGWGWQSVHDPVILPKVMRNWTAAIAAGQPFEMEFPLRGANGSFRIFLTRVQPLRDAAGQVVQWFGTNTDVEVLKEAEEKVRLLNAELEQRVVERTAQLETANKELEAFSYSVSHDLRAPLRAVDGFSQAVLEDYGAQLPEEGQRYLQTIREGAQQMGLLIDDLLTFSRLSRAPLKEQEVQTGALVRSVLDDLRAQQAGRHVDLRIGELPACMGDPALLRQVWINLLSNALKYTQKRDRAVVEVGCEATPEGNVYFVRDNGTGFDMRYAGKLFGVFQRLHRAEDYEGTGVGLAIVQRIIHRHGGRIWAQAEVDRGATFYFTLAGATTP